MKLSNKIIKKYIFIIISILVDTLILLTCLRLSMELYIIINTLQSPENFQNRYYWIVILTLCMLLYEKIYHIRFDFWEEIKKIFSSIGLALLTILVLFSLSEVDDLYSKTIIIVYFALAMILLPVIKRVFKRILFRYDYFKLNIKIISKEKNYKILANEFNKNWYLGLKTTPDVSELIIINSRDFQLKELENLIQLYTHQTKDVFVIPYVHNIDFSHATIIDYSNIRLSAIHIENQLMTYQNIIIKSISEKFLVLLLLPFILCVHIIIVLLIRFDSTGKIIFKQKRLGKDGKEFSCYKYRTMYENSDNLLAEYLERNPDEVEHYKIYHKYKNDPRITKIGRFLRNSSLDEFPQFFNVLRGDMNLIGPRPYMLNEKVKIKSSEDLILKVKPGITGLWQVNGRSGLTFKQRVELDKQYIQNWSLWIDFVIFLKTIKVVLSKIGAK